MIKALVIYNTLALLLTSGLLLVLNRIKTERAGERSILLIVVQQSFLALGAILYPIDGFARIQLLVWGIFLYFPIMLMGILLILPWENRKTKIFLLVILVLTTAVAVDAFVVEPHSLEVSRLTLTTDKLSEPLRIAFLADIQTDHPGSFEENVLELVKDENPDLILLAGDYLQISHPDHYRQSVGELHEIFLEAGLSPRLGMYAVRGNVDWNGWDRIFADLDVFPVEETTSFDLGPLTITGIGWLDSENPNLRISASDKYHIVIGHSPNFSLGEIGGDLLLAGHTHGGQVQLPGIGPLMTLSAVPRSWASGLTEIHPGQFLLVSRGIGMERGSAPRLRFLCRPELIILDLLPSGNTSD